MYEATDTKDPAIIAKKNALDEAEAASEQSLQDLQKEFSARQGVLPGSSKFAEGKVLYDQGKGLKSVLAWTKESGPLEYIQRKESLESLPEIAGRTKRTIRLVEGRCRSLSGLQEGRRPP